MRLVLLWQNDLVHKVELIHQNGSKLTDDSLDLVLITNLLFQVEDEKAVLVEAKRVLKPGGKILVVEWLADSSLGPKEKRVSANKVKQLAEEMDQIDSKNSNIIIFEEWSVHTPSESTTQNSFPP